MATVSATLRALDGAPLAHLAAHGHHDQENFLFSRLDLADGPLMAYDIQQLATAPRHVVLSSCDVGRTVVRPGEEILGFTAALLYIGTATVISSVTRVGDAAAVGMMTAYHRLLAAGTRPARRSPKPLSPRSSARSSASTAARRCADPVIGAIRLKARRRVSSSAPGPTSPSRKHSDSNRRGARDLARGYVVAQLTALALALDPA